MGKEFDGFTHSDFSTFQDKKWEDPRFNRERKIVWQKMKDLQPLLDAELERRGFVVEGKVSQYWINYTKRHVNGIWLAYTDIKPYYVVCQLNCGIYNGGFFIGIEINEKATSQLTNVAKFTERNKDELLSYIRRLDPRYLRISYGKCGVGPGKVSVSDIQNLLDALKTERSWFDFGEWYPKTEGILKSAQLVSRISEIFEILNPLYLVFAGRRPTGKRTVERLQRVGNVKKEELVQTEKRLRSKISQLSANEVNELIGNINRRNKIESGLRQKRETGVYRRNPVLSAALKVKNKDRCQICRTTQKVNRGFFCDTHHIKPLKAGGMDISDNILVLCPNHHRIFDRSHCQIILQNRHEIRIRVGRQVFNIGLS
jgi:hypothetical protein